MQQRAVGRSGLRVSRTGLGTVTWGHDTDEAEAAALLTGFLDAGGTLVETADTYGAGASEATVGRLLATVAPRADLVLAVRTGATPPGCAPDASRRRLLDGLDASLARLGTDHVDLWLVAAWDPATPLAETCQAMDAALTSGRARYVGVGGHTAWQLAAATTWQAAAPGRAPVVAASTAYSLAARADGESLLPAARHLGVGVLAASPLGGGVLTGKYRDGTPADSRAAASHLADTVLPHLGDRTRRVVDALATAADGLGADPLAVALAWARDRDGVAAALLGPRTSAQLGAALAAEELVLPDEIRAALDDVSADPGTGPGPGAPGDVTRGSATAAPPPRTPEPLGPRRR